MIGRHTLTAKMSSIEHGRSLASCAATLTDDLRDIDWERLATVFERAPLGKRDAEVLRQSFTNSGVRCFAWAGRDLIGAGRAITDRARCAVILDVVLLPEYQGKGIGKQMMTYLVERAKAATILLYAVPGKEGFYQKFGFRKMKTAMGRFEDPEVRQQMGYIE